MPWAVAAAAVGAIGAVGGAVISSNAAEDAAKTQAQGARDAAAAQTAAQEKGFNIAEGYLKPYATLGDSVLPALKTALGLDGSDPAAMMEMLKKYPGYQFAVEEGQKGVNTAQIGLGGNAMQSMTPNAAKALSEFNRNSAANLYDGYVSKLFNFGQMGQSGANALANAAIGVQTNIGNAKAEGFTGAANAQAAGTAAQGNIWGNTVTKVGQLAGSAINSYDWSNNVGNNGGLQTYSQNSSGDWSQPQWGMW